jgi:hypothetical protein
MRAGKSDELSLKSGSKKGRTPERSSQAAGLFSPKLAIESFFPPIVTRRRSCF